VLLGCAAAGALGPLLLPALMGTAWPLWLWLFLWGGLFAGVYTISLTLLGQHFRDQDLVTANTALALIWSVGSLAGPFLGGLAMDLAGRDGLPGFLAAAGAVYLAFALYRHRRTGGAGY
jgi:MFS family permease